MPILKCITGHSGCGRIQSYLQKGGRALAIDLFNLSWDERDGYGDDPAKADVPWAEEMDDVRHRAGNDTPYRGRPARTYKHYILSPDPADGVSLDALRGLACDWVARNFDDYQVAIVYHDDNGSGIPHAHIVVNNTNLRNGKRLQVPDPLKLNREVQAMARERGMRGLSNDTGVNEGLARLAARNQSDGLGCRTIQRVYVGRQEKELVENGSYSWVADIRNRVSVAKALAQNEGEFRQILGMLGIDVAERSAKAKRDDWIYSLSDDPAKKVTGGRLGLLFAKDTVLHEFERAGSYHPDAKSSRQLLRNARDAVAINDLQDLDRLSDALGACARNGTSSLRACDRRIAWLRSRAQDADGAKASSLQKEADKLQSARDFMADKGLLPEGAEPRGKTPPYAANAKRKPTKQKSSTANQPRRQYQEHERKQERGR